MSVTAALLLMGSGAGATHSPQVSVQPSNLSPARQVDCTEYPSGRCLLTSPQLKWAVSSSVNSEITVSDGQVYFISKDADGSYMVALDEDNGQLKWRQRLAPAQMSPPVAGGGLVYVGSDTGTFYAFEGDTGAQKWTFTAKYNLTQSPPAYAQGLLVFSDGPTVYALDARTGKRRWNLETSAKEAEGITIRGEVIYLLTRGRTRGAVWALDLTSGAAKWVIRTGQLATRLTASRELVGFFDRFELRVVDAKTGSDKWRRRVGDSLSASLQVTGEFVYLRSGSQLSAFSGESGVSKWELHNLGLDSSEFLLAADDAVYLWNYNYLVAADDRTGVTKWRFAAKDKGASIALNGKVLTFVDATGWIYSARLLQLEFSMPGGQSSKESPTFDRENSLLAMLENDVKDDDKHIVFSPDGQRVAFVAPSKSGYWKHAENVVVDDSSGQPVTGQEFYLVFRPVFGRDHTQLAYRVLDRGSYADGSKAQVVIAEKGEILWEHVSEQYGFAYDPVFSPDGTKLAYKASYEVSERAGMVNGGPWFMVVNGAKKESFDIISAPLFSPDSKHLAYLAGRGRAGASAGMEGSGRLSPWLAYADKWLIVLDDIKQQEYDWVGEPVFSPDSNKIAYPVKSNNRYFILNGERKEDCPGEAYGLKFSPDGKTLAYAVRQNEKSFIVVGRKSGKTFYWADNLTFSRDGKQLAYRARIGENKWAVVISPTTLSETKVGKAYDSVSGFVVSPDGKLIAYQAKRGESHIVVVGGQEGNAYEETGPPAFNSDGTQTVYRARRGRVWSLVVGTREVASYNYLTDPIFSPDGTKIGFGARSGNQLFWKVVPAPAIGHSVSGDHSPNVIR